jgi:IS4 transposase
LYLVLQNPKKHFAYDYHIAYELSKKLKEKKITNIFCENRRLQKRLRFYNIQQGNEIYLTSKVHNNYDKITVKYYNKNIQDFYILTR